MKNDKDPIISQLEEAINDNDMLLEILNTLPLDKQEMFLEIVAALKIKFMLENIHNTP